MSEMRLHCEATKMPMAFCYIASLVWKSLDERGKLNMNRQDERANETEREIVLNSVPLAFKSTLYLRRLHIPI